MRKVMLVEDEEFILEGLSNIMDWELLDMEVLHKAHNGKEALLCWEREPVDIVITDINMPVMDGLKLLHALRKENERVRFILLTGYDEFEYAREAIHLDVEDYILKPIDEEGLENTLRNAYKKLEEYDYKKATNVNEKVNWLRYLNGNLKKEEENKYKETLPAIKEGEKVYCAVMKVQGEDMLPIKIAENSLKTIRLSADSLLLLLYTNQTEEEVCQYFLSLLSKLESTDGILSFISMGSAFFHYEDLPSCYKEAVKLQKYQVIEGFGSCISPKQIEKRKSEDISIDDGILRKLIFRKDKEGSFNYIEDLFINNIKKDIAVEDIYQMSLKIAMILQDIKAEYKLRDNRNMRNLTDLIERIYEAQDLLALKMIFLEEIIEIIHNLHEDDSQYTPVVKQIMAEVEKNYKEDMNLKTLSYKYNMNASYLGQIFQKEVGCSFAQYLSNIKNGVAKDLILNTNMKINDIASEVGYPDSSYFYRKFKKCFGVSPASLREMKKY